MMQARLTRLRSADFWYRFAVGACGCLLICLVSRYLVTALIGSFSILDSDFVSYYSAAHLVGAGAASHIYDLISLGRYERALAYPFTVSDGVLPYEFPPYLAMLMSPLGELSYPAAWTVWAAGNCLLVLLTLALLSRYLRLARTPSILFWLACLSFVPVPGAVVQGQTSIMLLTLFTGAFFASRGRHPWLAGVLLSVTLVKPQYAIPFLLVLAMRRHWSALAAFAVSSALLMAVPMLVLGPNVTWGYLHILRLATTWHGQFGYQATLNQSIAGFAQLLAPGKVATGLTVVISLALLACVVRAARRSAEIEIPLGLATVVGVAISPHVLIHDMALLILPAAIAVKHYRSGSTHLGAILLLGYLAAITDTRIAAVAPVQVSVLAMLALAGWLYRASHVERSATLVPVPRYVASLPRPQLRSPEESSIAH